MIWGGGKYEVTTLVKSERAKQVVWRFKIPDIYPYICLLIKGDVKVEGIFCDGDQVDLAIVDKPTSIIVTNRKLLFDKYGDNVIKGGSDDVLKLLRELYFLSDWRTYSGASGIVYYVDHYNETSKNWDQNVDYTDETTANRVANIIDYYIEEWAKKTNPSYLMIVGGDEIIPFYRLNDANYYNTADDDPYYSDDPVLHTFDENYFLSDNPYADTSGNDYDIGKLELSIGRIVGCSAEDMKKFIENRRPADLNKAIVADSGKINDAIDALEEKATVEKSKTWTDVQLENELKSGFQIFLFDKAHGNYNRLLCSGGGYIWDDEIDDINSNGAISDNRPHSCLSVCRTGVVTDEDSKRWKPEWDDCLLYALVNQSSSGVIAAGGKTIYPIDTKLINPYFSKLIKNSMPFGKAFRDAKRDYKKGVLWDGGEKKTVTEFIYYGVPWSTIDPPQDSQQGEKSSDVSIEISNPIYISENIYSRLIEVNVTNYTISKIDGYDLIEINGTELALDEHKPIIPLIEIRLFLPLESNILGLSLVDNITSTIGNYNIPSFVSAEEPLDSGYEPSVGTGFYPSPIYQTEIRKLENQEMVIIKMALIQYNAETNEVVLYNYTKLELTYQTPIPITITDFSPDKIEYTSGETINASVTVENVGVDDLTNLKANLSLKDPLGRIVASNEKTFDIASGESKTIYVTLTPNIPHGVYLAEMNILGSGVLASSSEYITIKTGEIVNFTCPSEVKGGDLANFTISFKNGYQTSVEATGVVYIYDKDNIKVGEIYSAPIQIPANSIYDINISWDTTGRKIGNYTASAVVLVESEQFGPEYCTFEIKQKPFLHTDLPNVELISADPTVTSINVTLLNLSEINETYKPEECITLQSAYMINSTGAGNFTLRFTNIPNANTIIVYKIDPTSEPPNQWIELDATTTANTVTFTMSVEDPPVVFCSGAAPARVPTLTPIGIIALAGLLLIIGISRIKKRK